MHRYNFIYVVLWFVSSCNSKSDVPQYKNGLNYVLNDAGEMVEEFYAYNNELNGIYLRYEDSIAVEYGGYSHNKKDGLWDTLIQDPAAMQTFYNNDTPAVHFKQKYYFNYYQYDDYDFTVLCPVSWKVVDSLAAKAYVTATATTFKGKIQPRYMVYRVVQDSVQTLKTLMEYSKHKIGSDSSIVSFKANSESSFTAISTIPEGDTIVYDVKMITTQTGIYALSCQVDYAHYFYYKYIFKTIANSFNPVSGILQN